MKIEIFTLGGLTVLCDGREAVGLASQPVRASLLVYLAVEGSTTRESVVSKLWPDQDAQPARHTLSQTLYQLRQDLGGDWLHSDGEKLEVTPALWIDAEAFERGVDGAEHEESLTLYRGPFLDACRFVATNEFETWVDRHAARLARLHRRARRERLRELAAAGDTAAALDLARAWVEVDPIEDEAQHALIELLVASGRREAALRQYDEYAQLLGAEDLQPLDHTRELAERLRQGEGVSLPLVESPAASMAADKAAGSRERVVRVRFSRARWAAVAGALGLAAILATLALVNREPDPILERERVVVLPFANETGEPDLDRVGAMAADWITQALAYTGSLRPLPSVEVSHRLQSAAPEGSDDVMAHARALAEAAHAGTLVSGRFYRRGGELEFFAQVTDVGSGELWYAAQPVRGPVEAPERAIDALSQRITGTLAARVHQGPPLEPPTVLRPPTYAAYVAFLQGVELFWRGAFREAIPYLDEAARLDTTFVRSRLVAASAYGNIGNDAAAESVLAIVARRGGELAPYERAHVAYFQARYRGDLMAAHEAGRRISELAPGGPAHYVWLRSALGLGQARQVLEALRTMDPEPDWAPPWFDGWAVLASAQHAVGEYRRELETARRDRQARPERLSVLFLELRALAALDRIDELRRRASAVAAFPQEPGWSAGDVLQRAAAELKAHGHPEPADEMLARATTAYQSAGETDDARALRIGLAGALARAGRLSEADSLVTLLQVEDPEDLTVLGVAGIVAARRGDRDAAERISRRLATIDRRYLFGEHTYWRACIAAHLDRAEEAVALLREAFAQGRRLGFHLHADPNLEPLWDLPAFQALVDGRFSTF